MGGEIAIAIHMHHHHVAIAHFQGSLPLHCSENFAEAIRVSLESAFGVEGPCHLTDAEKLSVLNGEPTLESLCSGLKAGHYKNVIVMVGAGASVAAGIPDFRTPGSGLYDNLEKYSLPRPQAVFEMDYFRQN